ncbi:DUF3857 domain-containing protein [Psychroserpens jangbogonensis]|uniref:DUF3857 domain-containing protein n=1 Tax=Psychroserpens jangbogonensis TaxID=1484460 RepID=UPI00053E9991|nr:DUF3857 domain-containing protein [Psychroserpens jangbogonensis]
MKLIFSLLLVFITSLSYSQSEYNSEGLKVTKADIEQKVFSKDSTANALVIFEVGNSYIDNNEFKLHTEIKRKLKIINREGFNKATVEIVLYNNDSGRKEIVENIIATVYNINNGVVEKSKLSKADIIEEKYNDNYKIVKFTFPNIQEGSVINYSYDLTTPFKYKYRSWSFQEDIPTLYSEYNASIPGNWEYNIKLVGGRKLFSNEADIVYSCIEVNGGGSANCATYRYVMKDIPAFIEEDFMTTRSNYLARIEYELNVVRSFDGTVDKINKSWGDTDQEIRKDTDFGRMMNKGNIARNVLAETTISSENDLEKTKDIYDYVRNNFNWNGDHKLFNDVSLKNLAKEKTGTATEINMLLYNLLIENDIEAKPLLISTRENGLVTKIYPVLSDFNYVLIHVNINGKTYLLDANNDYLSFGQIPYKCLNQYGRLFNTKKGSSWFDIKPKETSLMSYRSEMEIDDEYNLNGKFELRNTDYKALSSKKEYFSDSEQYLNTIADAKNGLELSNPEYHNLTKTDSTFKLSFDASKSLDLIGDKLYLNPYFIAFFSENPFKLQERSYPVDFGYKQSFIYTSKLNLGENYSVEELPESKKINLPENAGSLITNYSISGNSVLIYFKLTFNKAIYEPIFYQYLKDMMKDVVDIQKNAILVLTKKN